MDFVGPGRRLAQGDIGEAAKWLGLPTAALLAFVEVEAAGRGFDAQNRPKMLFEPHVFWRELGAGTARDLAVRLGVAYPKWGQQPYPKESYTRLKVARTVDATKSLRSASWGLGQILADKAQLCGHPTEEAFVRANMQGEREQLLCMVALMIAWGIPKMLAGKDLSKAESWTSAARKWNGSGYAKHNYHGRIAAAFAKHSAGSVLTLPGDTSMSPEEVAFGVLKKGMKGEAVRNLQNDLAGLGYEFTRGIDGRFGDETDSIVRQFQQAWGLEIDGKVGPRTRNAINAALKGLDASGTAAPQPPVITPDHPASSRAPAWLIVLVLAAAGVAVAIAILTGAFNVR